MATTRSLAAHSDEVLADSQLSLPELDELGRVQRKSIGYWQRAWNRFRRNYVSLFALMVLICIVLVALCAPLISHFITHVSYTDTDLVNKTQRPGTPGHPLGTDNLGRDVLTRLAYGARVTLRVALLSVFFIMLIGGTIGSVAGYVHGSKRSIAKYFDPIAMRFVDALICMPTLIILVLVSSFYQPSPDVLALFIAVFSWAGVARLVRGEVMSLKERDYVDAARASGASDARIISKHIMPNIVPLLIVFCSLAIPELILYEAALSYLGLGVRPPDPSWGNMLNDAKEGFRAAPYLVIIPGMAIYITVLAVNLVGTGLRDALDPHLGD